MNYAPQVRVVPADGPETTYAFSGFASTRGPTINLVRYLVEKTTRVGLNRNLVERRFGARPVVQLRFELLALADEAVVAAVASALLRDDVEAYLSEDGGVTERRVRLASSYRREPLAGKALAGLAVSMDLEVLDLIPAIPPGRPGGVTQW